MYILIIMAVLAGSVLPIQAGLGIQLGRSVQQPIFGAFASFLVGAIGSLVVLILIDFDFKSVQQSFNVPAWPWAAGLLAAFYVISVFLVAPKLGAALTFALVVVGQLILSTILDHYGLFGFPAKPVNIARVTGVIFLILGVILIKRF